MSRSRSRDIDGGGGVVPFCALKIGPLSCFCLSLPQQSADRPRKFRDEQELLAEVSEEEEEELMVRPERPSLPEPRSKPTPQPRPVRRPSAAALELSRSLSRRTSKEFARFDSQNGLGSGVYPTGSLSLELGRDMISKNSSGMLSTSSKGALTPIVRWMDPEASSGDMNKVAESEEMRGKDSFHQELDAVDETEAEAPDPAEVEEVQAFHEAVRCGKFLDAQRELDRLRQAAIDPSEILGDVLVERVGRITSKYELALKMFQARMEDFSVFEKNDNIGIKWGITFQNSILKVLFEVEFPDMDVVRAFAAVQERDLHKPFNAGLVSAHTLGEETPCDSIWRSFTFSKTTSTKSDNLTYISGVDALDESPFRALWAGHYNVTDDAAAVAGVQIPPPEEGHSRSSYALTAYSLQPTVALGGGDRSQGVRMRVLTETKLPSVIGAFLSVMPSFALKTLARSKIQNVPAQFKDFVLTSKELDGRLAHGPRREFYATLRERLAAG